MGRPQFGHRSIIPSLHSPSVLRLISASELAMNSPRMYSPSLDEFQQLAAKGNLIPVARRLLADFETPLSAYRKIRGQGESLDRKSTRLNSSHITISYAVFC